MLASGELQCRLRVVRRVDCVTERCRITGRYNDALEGGIAAGILSIVYLLAVQLGSVRVDAAAKTAMQLALGPHAAWERTILLCFAVASVLEDLPMIILDIMTRPRPRSWELMAVFRAVFVFQRLCRKSRDTARAWCSTLAAQ